MKEFKGHLGNSSKDVTQTSGDTTHANNEETIWYDTCSDATPLSGQDYVKGPKATSLRPDQTIKGCRVGSTVQVECNGTKTGVLRWMGYVTDPNKLLAGLEMVK